MGCFICNVILFYVYAWPSPLQLRQWQRQKLGLQSASNKVLADRLVHQEGKAVCHKHFLWCGRRAADFNWGCCPAVEGILRGSPSVEEAEVEDSEAGQYLG